MASEKDIIVNLKVEGVEGFKTSIKSAEQATDSLESSIKRMEDAIKTVPEGSKDFKRLTSELDALKTVANSGAEAFENNRAKLAGYKKEISGLATVMATLKAEGKQGTQVFKDIEKQFEQTKRKAGELQDKIGDINAEIKALGSDTRGIDLTLRGVQSLTAGYQVLEGASGLLGKSNEDLQKQLVKLNQLMLLGSGIQQIAAEATREDSIFKLAAAKATALYALVVGESTGALKFFRLALAATGIGAVIAVVYLAVKAWQNWNENINKNNKLISDAKKAGAEYYASETTKLNALLAVAKNKELSDKTRQIAIDNINKLYPEYLSNLSLENINTRETNKAISQQVGLISKLAMLKGTTKLIEELGQKLADLQTQTGDASLLDRVSTSISSGNWFANAEEATKIFRDKQEKEANEQISKIVALQKKLTSELDKAGFGTQALSALGVELPQDEVKKIAEKTVKAVKKEVEKTPIEIKVEQKKELNLTEDTPTVPTGADMFPDEVQTRSKKYFDEIISRLERVIQNVEIGSDRWIVLNQQIEKTKALMDALSTSDSQMDANAKKSVDSITDKIQSGLESRVEANWKAFEEETKINDEREKATKDTSLRLLNDYTNGIFNIAGQAMQIQVQNELAQLDERRKKGLITEKQYQKESARIKNEAAQKQRDFEIAEAAAKIPLAALNAYISALQVPVIGLTLAPIMAGIAAGFATAQLALIASAPLPKFREGGSVAKRLGLINGKKHEQGGVPIEVEGGEYVVKSESVRKYGVKMLDNINAMKFNPVITHSKIGKRDNKLNENLVTISSYLKQGYKIDAQGNQILKEIRDNINKKAVYV